MYIVNDIELLNRLGKHKILDYLMRHCIIAVSAIRLNDYSFGVRKVVESNPAIKIMAVDAGFDNWFLSKRKYLSVSDLSSIYVALINGNTTLVLSGEDHFLTDEIKNNKLEHLQFDDFAIKMIKDERIIQLYNIIKVA